MPSVTCHVLSKMPSRITVGLGAGPISYGSEVCYPSALLRALTQPFLRHVPREIAVSEAWMSGLGLCRCHLVSASDFFPTCQVMLAYTVTLICW
jgi:hypothetical protein